MNVTATVGGNVLGDQEEKEKSMKIKKSTKALAAAASLAMMATVGLSACGGGSNDAETTADGKVKITMWHGFSEADGKTLEANIKGNTDKQD